MDSVLMEKIKSGVCGRRLMENTEKLWRLELGQQHADYIKSAAFAENLLAESGLSRVERIPFPADGKTVFQDKTMPLCWKASKGRLDVVKSPLPFQPTAAADLSRHPFHLVKGSVSTPPGGVRARLITWEQLFAGQDARGAVVIAPPDARGKTKVYSAACDAGALAVVHDWLGSRYETPDAIHWVNGWTEGPHWHTIRADRPLIGFSVSPRTGDMLRNAARMGEVLVHVESDGENYEGEIDLVTGVVPGKSSRELWLLAHLYEPLSADNSSGAACAAEIARCLGTLAAEGEIPRPDFSIRVLLGLEMYGFAAYAASRGSNLKEQVIGALNLDGIAVTAGGMVEVSLAPPFSGFHGNYAAESLLKNPRANPFRSCRINESGMYADDTFLSDPTVNVPTLWFLQKKNFWHNSIQTMDVINAEALEGTARFCACWAYKTARAFSPGEIESLFADSKEKIRLEIKRRSGAPRGGNGVIPAPAKAVLCRLRREKEMLLEAGRISGGQAEVLAEKRAGELEDFASSSLEKLPRGESPAGGYYDIAASYVCRRASTGFPFDLARAPREDRRNLPGGIIYGPLARILSNMDGRKNLLESIEEAAWEVSLSESSAHADTTGRNPVAGICEADVKQYIAAVEYLTGLGYIETSCSRSVSAEDILEALKRAGVRPGSALFVHSSLSPFGHVEGGAEAVIDALLEALGRDGTLVMPEFTRSFVYFDGECAWQRSPRPFDVRAARDVVVGAVPRAFLGREGVARSCHPTHSAAACGPLAAAFLGGHMESDSPCGRTSPMAELLESDGDILWFGADLSATTFFHFLEDEKNLPYLASAVCVVKDPDGSPRAVLTPKNLPGHRDFYRRPGISSKMYARLIEKGLEIRQAALGFGDLKLIGARRLYALGSEILDEDPSILLCDDEDCGFCSGARKKLRGVPGAPGS